MCGRMNISDHEGVQWLLNHLGLKLDPEKFTARYNVAPTTAIWGVARSAQDTVLAPMEWGFVPPWAKPGQFKRPLTNARAETIHEKPSFKHLIRSYRGIIPANGFYEWKRAGSRKQPYLIDLPDDPAMAIGTICQMHGDGYFQCCVVTTDANQQMQPIHNRQPVLLAPEQIKTWLCDDTPSSVAKLLQPSQVELRIRPINDFVNNARNEGPDCTVLQKPPE